MKKILTFVTLLVFILSFVGCKPAEKQPAISERTIKLAHVVNEKDSFHISALKFKEVVEAKTNGKIKVEIHPNGELGDERTLIEGMQQGTIDMGVITDGPVSTFLPEIAVFDMPFLFKTPEEAYKILDGPIGQKVLKDLETVQLHGLAFAERGFRSLTNNKRPVKMPEDVKGLKIRVMQNPVYIDTFNALGANTVPMAWGDCLTALKQGTIDGQENPVVVIYSYKLWETQKYLSLTRHTYAPAVILMSLKLWNSLSPDEQAIFTEAGKEAAEAGRKYDNDNEKTQLDEIKANGMQVIEDVDVDAFRKAVEPVYTKYSAQFGDLLKQIQDALKK